MSARLPESERPSVVPAVLAATALVVVLATWAAAIGPDRVFGSDPVPRETSSGEGSDPDFSQSHPGEEDEDDGRGWGATAILGVEIALLVVVGYLVVLIVRWVRVEVTEDRRRRRRRQVDFEVLPVTPEQAAERWCATPTSSWPCW